MVPGPFQLAAARGWMWARRSRRRGRGRDGNARAVAVGRGLTAIAPVERRVVGEDRCVQALQRLAGVDAEFAGEQFADPLVGGERVGLPAAAVQRQHELAVQPLPQRMPGGQLLQLGDERVVPAERQVGVDPGLQNGEPQFLQPGGLGPGEGVVGQVGQHRAAPQIQRLAQRLGGFGVPASFQLSPSRGEAVLEQRRVQVLMVHVQHITAVPGQKDVSRGTPGPVRLQRLAQVEHIGLQGRDPPLRWVPAPDILGQPVHRHDPVRLKQ